MKRFLLSILMVVIGLTAFSQSPSRFISLRPAYPVAIGESTIDDVEFSNNGLYMYDILQDSLPQYEIGQISAQTVRYTEDGHGFYVKADSLHSLNVVYSCEVNDPPQGTIEFNETTGRFKFYPAAEDYKSFVVTFSATNGTENVSEDVTFNLMPRTAPEMYAFQTQGVMPDAGDYTIVAETSKSLFLNNEQRTAYSISISGKDVVFDDAVKNKVYGMNGREDIYELNIYAERLVIRSSLSFPQTNITIYAKELVFEDHDTVFAYINTTPSYKEFLTDGAGANGANAGDITLYVKEFKGNVAKRLILNGAKGQSTNRNGTPGNGGNGGTLTSTIDVSSYCDFARGSAGVRFDVPPGGEYGAGPVISAGAVGGRGRLELISECYAYLHPYYISAVMRHANDAFINNYTNYALQTCKEHRTQIDEYMNSAEWENCGIEEELELQNGLTEIDNMLFRLEQGLDYFGNPQGWVPLLSFETYFATYDNEIERAIPTLYMYYWLSHIDQTLQHMVEASEFAAHTTETEIENCQDLLNSLVLEIPVLKDKADEVETMIDALMARVNILKQKLLAKAKKNVKKKNRINKAVAIVQGVANVLPVLGPVGAGVGTSINMALSNAEVNKFIGKQFGINYSSAVEAVGTVACSEDFFSTLNSSLTEAKNSIGDLDFKGLSSAFKSLGQITKPLITSINNVNNILSQSSTPDKVVQAEYDRLKAECPEWQSLNAQVDSLTTKKIELLNHIDQVGANIIKTMSELSGNVLALDGLRRDVFTGNSKRDLNAMQYLAKMEQRAKGRLLKYDYYLRKAYEYRLLEPYEGEEFNLVGMFERYEELGRALGNVIDNGAYKDLGSVYRDRLSDMTHKIIEKYTYSQPEKTTTIPITITKEQLDAINANGSMTLNLYEQDYGSYFFQDEENIRIVNLGVKYIKAHAVGSASRSRLAIDLTHSGISQYRKDGQIYWFNHMSQNTDNPHFWRTTISFNDVGEETNPETHQNSVAISSLFSTILNNNIENVMLFSRPSVWSDITMSKQVQTNGDDIVIDSLVLELQFDYTLRRNNSSLRNIDITANENLLPYIACSAEDINGRTNGNGILYRSYRMSNQPVTFSAIEKYGTYHFLNWTDRSGKVVSDKADLTVNRQKDQFYVANYERRIPILNVTDTIRVSNEENEYIIYVNNIGSGDMEMDWYVSDSLSSWVHLNGITEGIDDGYFTFTVDANTSGANRLDSLEIFAPETEAMSKMIYISQVNGPFDEDKIKSAEGGKDKIRIYPNPMQEFVKIEGEGLLSVCIYSITGKEMYRRGIDGSDTATIDVAGLPNGIYILSVNTRNGLVSKKMLKTN